MRFLIKLAIFGFLGLLILPAVSPVEDDAAGLTDKSTAIDMQSTAPSIDAVRIAVGLAGDIKNICSRDPQMCEAGGRLAEAAMSRAKDGALVLARMVEEYRAEQTDAETTGSIK